MPIDYAALADQARQPDTSAPAPVEVQPITGPITLSGETPKMPDVGAGNGAAQPEKTVDYAALADQARKSGGGGFLHEAFVNPAKQAGAGLLDAAAFANHLTANTFDLLDRAADTMAKTTGTSKGGFFRSVADWARGQETAQRENAENLSGGRQDLASQIYRGGAEGLADIPAYMISGHLLGPVAGMAGISALSESDKGFWPAMQAAAKGGLLGKTFEIMGPFRRPIRLTGTALMTFAQGMLDGQDLKTALAHTITMTGMNVPGEGQVGFSQAAENLIPRVRSQLNPKQQEAIDYLKSEGVPVKAGTQTGNKYLKAWEAVTAHSPLGAGQAQEFQTAAEEGLTGLSRNLAEQAYPKTVSPESVGAQAANGLQQIIGERSQERDDAYGRAWANRESPEASARVPVRMQDRPVLDAEGKPTGDSEQVPVYANVNMPTDIRALKEQAAPVYDELKWTLTPAEQSASAGFNAIERLLKSDDFVPAWQAEHALSGLKSMARTTRASGVRDIGQGVAANLVEPLQTAIDRAVAQYGGDDALAGLREGRQIHADVMDVAELRDQLRAEPVQAFRQLTWQKDAGIGFLRRIADRTPELMPQIGRAYVEQLFEQATLEGGFQRAMGILRQWENLGPQSKKLLFPDAQVRAGLDKFFLGAKLIGENPNPSGTALVSQATQLNPFRWANGWLGGKLLFTPRGIALLTGALENPPATLSAQARLRWRAQRIAGNGAEGGNPPEPPDDGGAPPPGGPGGGSPPPGGGGAAPAPQNPLSDVQAQRAASRQEFIDRAKAAGSTPGESGLSEDTLQRHPWLRREQEQDVADEPQGAVGPHGPIFRNFYHNARGAVEELKGQQSGEAPGALWHPEIGDIDLIWGKDSKTVGPQEKPYGLAHIIEQHPGDENKLAAIMADTHIDPENSGPNRIRLKSDRYAASVRLDFDGQKKTWLLTGYERKQPPGAGPSTRPSSTPGSGGGTSLPPGGDLGSLAPAANIRVGEAPASSGPTPPETSGRPVSTMPLELGGVNPTRTSGSPGEPSAGGASTETAPAGSPGGAANPPRTEGGGLLAQLDQAGTEAQLRLRQRGIGPGSTVSANEFLNPETIRDMAQAIAGDVARGALKLEDLSARLGDQYGPRARLVAQRVWNEVQNALKPIGADEFTEHGPVFRGYWGDESGATRKLVAVRAGEAPGALYDHRTNHAIDLVWHYAGDKPPDWEGGAGLAHIEAKHPKMLGRIQQTIDASNASGTVTRRGTRRIYVAPNGDTVSVDTDYYGNRKRWVVTAVDEAKAPNSRGTLARPEKPPER